MLSSYPCWAAVDFRKDMEQLEKPDKENRQDLENITRKEI